MGRRGRSGARTPTSRARRCASGRSGTSSAPPCSGPPGRGPPRTRGCCGPHTRRFTGPTAARRSSPVRSSRWAASRRNGGRRASCTTAGARRFFDVVAVHPFTDASVGTAESVRRVTEIVSRVRAQMRRRGDRRKPIIITELSWPAAIPAVPRNRRLGLETTARGQKVLLTAAYRRLTRERRKLGITQAYWFTWASPYDDNYVPSDVSYRFSGLTRFAGGAFTRKPILSTYAAVAARYEGCRKSDDARRCRSAASRHRPVTRSARAYSGRQRLGEQHLRVRCRGEFLPTALGHVVPSRDARFVDPSCVPPRPRLRCSPPPLTAPSGRAPGAVRLLRHHAGHGADGSECRRDAALEEQTALMATSGVESLRAVIAWSTVEPGTWAFYDFTTTDRLTAAAARHGLVFLPNISSSRGGRRAGPPRPSSSAIRPGTRRTTPTSCARWCQRYGPAWDVLGPEPRAAAQAHPPVADLERAVGRLSSGSARPGSMGAGVYAAAEGDPPGHQGPDPRATIVAGALVAHPERTRHGPRCAICTARGHGAVRRRRCPPLHREPALGRHTVNARRWRSYAGCAADAHAQGCPQEDHPHRDDLAGVCGQRCRATRRLGLETTARGQEELLPPPTADSPASGAGSESRRPTGSPGPRSTTTRVGPPSVMSFRLSGLTRFNARRLLAQADPAAPTPRSRCSLPGLPQERRRPPLPG